VVGTTPYWQRLLVLLPALILLGRAFVQSVRESGHKRAIYASLGVVVVVVVILTYLGVSLPKEE
jgi:hypothetical protein